MKKYYGEFLATLILIMIGVGTTAIVAPQMTFLPSILVIGLGFFVAIYILANTTGFLSGGVANPAITLGLVINNRITVKESVFYIIAQFLGALAGGFLIFALVSGLVPEVSEGMLGTNMVAAEAPLYIGALFEVGITFIFVLVVLNITSKKNVSNTNAALVIGSTLAFLVMIALPLTGGSLNPARSFSVAIFEGGTALSQLWIFILFPALGGIIAGLFHKIMMNEK